MKKFLLMFVLALLNVNVMKGKTYIITDIGFTFSPVSIIINEGDTVDFQIDVTHNALEVSQSTWLANGITPISGGFSINFGGGKVKFSTSGVHYYVCQPHASMGMKGFITVLPSTGVEKKSFYQSNNFSVRPNPAGDELRIDYSLSENQNVRISIIELSGKIIRTIFSAEQSRGNYSIRQENNFASGIYFIRLETKEYEKQQKIVL